MDTSQTIDWLAVIDYTYKRPVINENTPVNNIYIVGILYIIYKGC